MRIHVHVSAFYDWEQLPAGVEPTPADIKARLVKPSHAGGWLMRVTKKAATHTEVALPEAEIAMLIVQDNIRDKLTHTRSEALSHYLARHVMPHHAHRSWMKSFDVHDDGPDQALFEALVDEHIKAGNIEALDKDALVASYMKPLESKHHVEHLHAHFGVKKGN